MRRTYIVVRWGSSCVANIGPLGARRRLLGGMAGLVTGLLVALVLSGSQVGPAWRVIAFVPLLGGALGFFQARKKT